MKKRILFVDDEPLMLQGLQRLLRSMRHEWDMEFVENGAQAMERIAQSPFDLVISDMRMPDMDGAELLQRIKEKSPGVIRLVLSGYAEQQLTMKCVGVAHQYLSKPCEPETLKSTVARLSTLGFAERNERISKVLGQLNHLPSLPDSYTRIVHLLNDPETAIDDVGKVIAEDVAMTVQILKLVNSSFFGLPRAVTQPAEAASFLGLETIKALVLATKVFDQFRSGLAKSFSVERFQRHSQEVGASARSIARWEKAPRSVVDDSLVAGLLHDVGKLVLAANLPDQYDRVAELVREESQTLLEAEQTVYGANHAEIGGYLLGLWGLPVPVVEAITLHHAPQESPTPPFSVLTAVHVADALAGEGEGDTRQAVAGVLHTEYLDASGLTDHLPSWRTLLEESKSN